VPVAEAIPLVQRLPLPAVVLAGAVLAVEAGFQLGAAGLIGGPEAVGWRMRAVTALGFSDPLFEHLVTRRRVTGEGLVRLVAYPLVHGGALHAVLGAVLVVALGKAVTEAFSTRAMVAVALAGAVVGALAYGVFEDSRVALIGVYPMVYGLIGGWSLALWRRADGGRGRALAFRLVGVMLGLQIVFRLVFGGADLWIADFAGFLAGFALAPLVAPGGAARLRAWRERLRAR
jgi:membrane associated rhomboid family serine protease